MLDSSAEVTATAWFMGFCHPAPQALYEKEAARVAPNPVEPEYRLHMTVWAAPLFAAAFFWFGWTSYPNISYWAPLMAGGVMGFAISWIFVRDMTLVEDLLLTMLLAARILQLSD